MGRKTDGREMFVSFASDGDGEFDHHEIPRPPENGTAAVRDFLYDQDGAEYEDGKANGNANGNEELAIYRGERGSDDNLGRYLDEMGRHPLLTKEGEARIGAALFAAEETILLALSGFACLGRVLKDAVLQSHGAIFFQFGERSDGHGSDDFHGAEDNGGARRIEEVRETLRVMASELSHARNGDSQVRREKRRWHVVRRLIALRFNRRLIRNAADQFLKEALRVREECEQIRRLDRDKDLTKAAEYFYRRIEQSDSYIDSYCEAARRGASLRERMRYAARKERARILQIAGGSLADILRAEARVSSALRDLDENERELIESNLRLGVYVVKRNYRFSGLEFADLIQEANEGLMEAALRFDYRKGYKFSTYATWWIRQRATRAIPDKSRLIRIPVHLHDILVRFSIFKTEFGGFNGREPELEEVARALNISCRKADILQKISLEPMSLDASVGGDDNSPLIEFIENPSDGHQDQACEELEMKQGVAAVLSGLRENERRVLVWRFGLQGHDAHTLEETGREFGVTRERIRQIEAQALKRLRNPSRAKRLRALI